MGKRISKNIVKLKSEGYDPFIDFLKGICIVLVILTHCIPSAIRRQTFFAFWGMPAVPIFLIIQVFHTYKKGLDNVKRTDFIKIWQRIIKPFLLIEFLLILIILCIKISTGNTSDLKHFFINIAKYGGRGSGAYFPWIYIQFAIILPLIVPILKRINDKYLAVTFILFSELIEIICNIVDMPEFCYRLLFLRYTMLIYLGCILTTKGFILNWKTLLLSIISAVSIFLLVYKNVHFSPWIFYVPNWKSCHWICYFYIAYILFFIFHFLYQKTVRHKKICQFVKKMGLYSYEIFLFQMAYFDFHHYVVDFYHWLINKSMYANIFAIVTALIICVVPVVLYKEHKASSFSYKVSGNE